MQKRNLPRRRDRIIGLLTAYGELSAQALSEMLEVSVQTIRSDLRGLDAQAVVQRRNGVASLRQPSENIEYSPRKSMARSEKSAIAQHAADFVPNGARVALGTGTTVEECARYLAYKSDLFVTTNNIHALLAMQRAKECVIMLAGGQVRLRDLDFIGTQAQAFFSNYRVDFAIFSCGGVSSRGEILDYNPDEITTRKALKECTNQTILLVDSTKFNKDLPCRHDMIWDHDIVVTDAALPENWHANFSRSGTQIIQPTLRQTE